MSENALVARLKELARREDRGALAALRRGLGHPPGIVPEMHPYVMPFLAKGAWTWRQQCHYIIAALFALHPASAPEGNMGDTLRQVAGKTDSESIEKRFLALLKCHRDDLFGHLRHAVSLAKGKDVPVCWETLFRDIRAWDDERRWVQRNWSRAYWGGAPAGKTEVSEQPAPTSDEGE